MKKKILFLIPNLKHGGAEKVLVNLVNNLNPEKYDITVQTLFDVGVHKGELKPHVHYISGLKKEIRGNSHLIKMIPPKVLWKMIVRKEYDIAVSYLEGPTSRIVAGCANERTKKIAWIHTDLNAIKNPALGFKNKREAKKCYDDFQGLVAVSQNVKNSVLQQLKISSPIMVLYNTNETEAILLQAKAVPDNQCFLENDLIKVCTVGKIIKTKGFDRLVNVHKRLLDEGIRHHIYIIGSGEEKRELEARIRHLEIEDSVKILGYQANPYQYVSKCDLYVCSSYREGFSTAVTEALIVGIPVVSTNCSGAVELLGENNEYGIVVENSEEGIYQGMKRMLSDEKILLYYKQKAKERGAFFSREKTIQAVENLFDNL